MPDPGALPTHQPIGRLQPVAEFHGPMPTGVAVSRGGRIFVNFPKWGDPVTFTVAELRDGQPTAYPDERWNRDPADDPATALVSVQSVVVDPTDRLWLLDTGSPMFQQTRLGGPKLVCVDLATDQVVRTILLPADVAFPATYLNDVRFNLRLGAAGTAFITDSGHDSPNGIIVVDLATGDSWRRLDGHPSTKAEPLDRFLPVVEGRVVADFGADGSMTPIITAGADGIALSADGARLYYCPLASRRLYSVSVDALVDRSVDDAAVAATVRDEGDRGGAADGIESDAEGNLYATSYEHDAVLRRTPTGTWETLVHDPRLLWPDHLAIAADGYLYVTANQLHRQPSFNGGRDLRQKPYSLFRIRVDETPLRLV